MNHTERIHAVARQVRGLTRDMAREAVELYLASAAEEVAVGGSVTLPSIGRLEVAIRKNSGRLIAHINGDRSEFREPGYRVQACLRLNDEFKARCRWNLLPTKPGSARSQPGDGMSKPGSARVQAGKQK
ncbi:MAG: HU family DNA-binding protein [Aggregatilineales bacterium]